jgi:hypothetical protein
VIPVIAVPTMARVIAMAHVARVIAVRLVRARTGPMVGVVSVLMVVWRLGRGVRHAGCRALTHVERRIPLALV